MFVCLSEHEGFCIPLLEAMRAGTPDRGARRRSGGGDPGRRRPPAAHGPPGHGGRGRRPGPAGRRAGRRGWSTPGTGGWPTSPRPITRQRFVEVLAEVAERRAGGGVKLAFVTPRYGTEVIGGAETAARMLAERLCLRPGWEVEVLTSCALDHLTWENTEPAGTTVINGVTVHRFPTASPRTLDYFALDGKLRVAPEAATLAESRQVGRPQRPDVPGPGRRGGRHRRRRDRLLPLPVRHHRGRHRRVEGARSSSTRRPTTSRPSTSRRSGAASATSTDSCTTPVPSGT